MAERPWKEADYIRIEFFFPPPRLPKGDSTWRTLPDIELLDELEKVLRRAFRRYGMTLGLLGSKIEKVVVDLERP
jgi:hypothetical protein